MVKKLHNYLLENYPFLWNLRLPSVLAVLAIFHLIHFTVGFLSYTDEYHSSWRNPESMYFSNSFFLFSMIGSAVIFILWLVRVFRNNAFKSFYPVANKHLFQEFIVFFIVCLLNISCYYSYTYGYVFHARNNTNYAENEKDIEVYNSVIAFLQSNKSSYSIENRCYPKPFPLSKRYNDNESEIPEENRSKNDYYYLAEDGQKFSPKMVDSMTGGYELSYLSSCNLYSYEIHSGDNHDGGYDIGDKNLIQNHIKLLNDPKMLKSNMAAFLKICDKHKIGYKLDVEDWFKWVYNPPYFPATYLIFQKYSYDNQYTPDNIEAETIQSALELNPKGYFIGISKLTQILQNTKKAQEYSLNLSPFLGFLYASLFMAVMIFTFRVSSRRTWMISLIGSALLCLIIGAISAVIGSAGGKEGLMFLYLCIIATFLIINLVSGNKTISGVCLNWFVWTLPFVFLIILGIGDNKIVENMEEYYFLVCLIIYLSILRLVLIPRFRAWQAMPEN